MSVQHWISYEGTTGWGLLPHQGQGRTTSEVHAVSLLDSSPPYRQQCLATHTQQEGAVAARITWHLQRLSWNFTVYVHIYERMCSKQKLSGCNEAKQSPVLYNNESCSATTCMQVTQMMKGGILEEVMLAGQTLEKWK